MDVRAVLGRLVRGASGAEPGAGSDAAVDIARYKYLLRVAPPQAFEQVHTDAFAQLSGAEREAVRQSMCRDLAEEARPVSADPEDLARSAAWAQDDDPGYLLRVLRRPGAHEATEPAPPAGRPASSSTRYAASVLGAVAAAAAASPAAAETLKGFSASLEAAQVDPSHFVPRSSSPEPPPGWLP